MIIVLTCVLLIAVSLTERVLLGPADEDEDPDADQL
jgi:hypothetical protein